MPTEMYEVVAQAARYWFLFLMALIVWRSYRWYVRDRKQRKKRLRLLPDAGFIGELVVVQGSAELPAGLALPVSVEGVLGSVRGCDVYVPVRGVHHQHLWFTYDEEEGLRVEPCARHVAEVDGQRLAGRRAHAYLTHGARLTVGEAVLRMRMFAGFEVAGSQQSLAPLAPAEAALPVPPPGAPQPPTVTLTPDQLAALQQLQFMAAVQVLQAQQAGAGQGQPTPPEPAAQPALYAGAGTAPMAPEAPALLTTAEGTFAHPAMLGQAAPPAAQEPDPYPAQPAQAVLHPEPMASQGAAMRANRRLRHQPLPPLAQEGEPAQPSPPEGASLRRGAAPLNALDAGLGFALDETPPTALRETFAPPGIQPDGMGGADHRFAPPVHFYPLVLDEDGLPGEPEPGTPEDAFFSGHAEAFYPPVMEEDALPPEGTMPGASADDAWPYAAYPQSGIQFVNTGYTDPEVVEPAADEPYEYADEDEAPRSLYVEPDEAERAKRLLWDRYLKGGRRP